MASFATCVAWGFRPVSASGLARWLLWPLLFWLAESARAAWPASWKRCPAVIAAPHSHPPFRPAAHPPLPLLQVLQNHLVQIAALFAMEPPVRAGHFPIFYCMSHSQLSNTLSLHGCQMSC